MEPEWVYIDGVFDLVHSGHLNGIRQASKLGNRLCVGVNSDTEVFAAKNVYPVLDQTERTHILSKCRWVTRTICGAPYETSLQYLRQVAQCDVVAHGDDMVVGASGEDCYKEPRQLGLFRVFRRTPGISSTSILCRLLLACQAHGLLSKHEVQITDQEALTGPIGGPTDTRRLLEFIGEPRAKIARCRASALLRRQTEGTDDDLPRIVYCAGMFDVLRSEQIDFLQTCKNRGDLLIVGLYSDAVASEMWGPTLPILSLSERMMSLYALSMVDEIILNAPVIPTPSFLARYGVQYLCIAQSAPFEPAAAYNSLVKFEAYLDRALLAELRCNAITVEVMSGCTSVNSCFPTLDKVRNSQQLQNIQARQKKNAHYAAQGTGVEAVKVEL